MYYPKQSSLLHLIFNLEKFSFSCLIAGNCQYKADKKLRRKQQIICTIH